MTSAPAQAAAGVRGNRAAFLDALEAWAQQPAQLSNNLNDDGTVIVDVLDSAPVLVEQSQWPES